MNRSEQILENYMQPVFYFALRKTSSREEAEDFTHNVMLDVLAALGNGFSPDNERAWVWKIARNHYAKWAARQTDARQTLDADEIREEHGKSIADVYRETFA